MLNFHPPREVTSLVNKTSKAVQMSGESFCCQMCKTMKMCPLLWGSVISEADAESDGLLSEIRSPFREVR